MANLGLVNLWCHLKPSTDCPASAINFRCIYYAVNDGTPMKISNIFCIFENHVGNIMWCHTELGIPRKCVTCCKWYYWCCCCYHCFFMGVVTNGIIVIYFFFFGSCYHFFMGNLYLVIVLYDNYMELQIKEVRPEVRILKTVGTQTWVICWLQYWFLSYFELDRWDYWEF